MHWVLWAFWGCPPPPAVPMPQGGHGDYLCQGKGWGSLQSRRGWRAWPFLAKIYVLSPLREFFFAFENANLIKEVLMERRVSEERRSTLSLICHFSRISYLKKLPDLKTWNLFYSLCLSEKKYFWGQAWLKNQNKPNPSLEFHSWTIILWACNWMRR